MTKLKLTPKRQKYLEERVKNPTGTKKDAALAAGYAPSVAMRTNKIETPDLRAVFAESMRKHISEGIIAQRVREGLDAKETKFFQCEGIVTDTREVISYSERRQYAALAAELAGYHIPHKTEIENKQAIIINISRDPETPLIKVQARPEV